MAPISGFVEGLLVVPKQLLQQRMAPLSARELMVSTAGLAAICAAQVSPWAISNSGYGMVSGLTALRVVSSSATVSAPGATSTSSRTPHRNPACCPCIVRRHPATRWYTRTDRSSSVLVGGFYRRCASRPPPTALVRHQAPSSCRSRFQCGIARRPRRCLALFPSGRLEAVFRSSVRVSFIVSLVFARPQS